jgi:type IV secretory pathway VirB10-like protein
MSTSGDQLGPIGRLRLAGFALLAIAALALVLGLITLFGGDKPEEAAQQTPIPSAVQSQAPPQNPPQNPPPTTVAPPPATSAPPQTPTSPPATVPAGPVTHNQPVRVYNNSTIKGLADRAAEDVRGVGWNVVEVANYSQGVIETTTVYFRPGTEEEAEAKNIATMFGLRAEPRFDGISQAEPGIIVIVTREYQAGKVIK